MDLNGQLSSRSNNKTGISKDSILGSLLFLVHINDTSYSQQVPGPLQTMFPFFSVVDNTNVLTSNQNSDLSV